MIMYENLSIPAIIDTMESLAYKVLEYNTPNYHLIEEAEVVCLLHEYGIDAYVDER